MIEMVGAVESACTFQKGFEHVRFEEGLINVPSQRTLGSEKDQERINSRQISPPPRKTECIVLATGTDNSY
jgi:hypothetical protein